LPGIARRVRSGWGSADEAPDERFPECAATGARWQRRALGTLEQQMPRTQALHAMLERYLSCAGSGIPVHLLAGAGVMSGSLRLIDRPRQGDVHADVRAFLSALAGSAAIRITGAERRRCRVVVTLLHGNEPSGARAVLPWLRGGAQPAVDVLCVLAAVRAALQPPGFAQRMLPGERDLNRCFRPPFDGAEGAFGGRHPRADPRRAARGADRPAQQHRAQPTVRRHHQRRPRVPAPGGPVRASPGTYRHPTSAP
jgi:hypothetical protein